MLQVSVECPLDGSTLLTSHVGSPLHHIRMVVLTSRTVEDVLFVPFSTVFDPRFRGLSEHSYSIANLRNRLSAGRAVANTAVFPASTVWDPRKVAPYVEVYTRIGEELRLFTM